MSQGWRTTPLPPNWPTIRQTILQRDPTCTIRTHCNGAPSTEVDHTGPPNNHHPSQLRGVCHRCHKARTIQQAHQARKTKYDRRRPTEPHPGRLTPPTPGHNNPQGGGYPLQ